MMGIIDTCSLVAIARYYLSLKDKSNLLEFLESKFRSRELVLLSTVHKEASFTQKGIAISLMKFLDDKTLHIKDSDLTPPSPRKFSNLMDNNFCIPVLRKNISDEQYTQQKECHMKTADIRMVIFALMNADSNPVIITEETPQNNDGKLFKKIPAICDQLEIKHMTVTEWLNKSGVTLNWTLP